eukprot:TRINITY_DN6554_c0_g1_i13.p1 TRINITY_DN6554_c0_g1~~TRINITY_DN6554_c0_g1_i13.p1  ORF type:complete len:1230 (-),score=383.40 TRINITY_DN6554_c0_g1_i13:120-3809(-)
MKGFIIVCGNPGSGKSAVVSLLQSLASEYIPLERNSKDVEKEWEETLNFLDEATLKYCFDARPQLPSKLQHGDKEYPIFWFILDARIEVIEQRLSGRGLRTIREVPKALGYFRERYRELSGRYGIPFIDSSQFTVEQEAKEIIRIIESGEYGEIAMVSAEKLNYDFIKERDIEAVMLREVKEEVVEKFDVSKFLYEDEFMNEEVVGAAKECLEFKKKLFARWLVHDNLPVVEKDTVTYSKENIKISVKRQVYFKLYTEGESKKLYKVITSSAYLTPVVIIILKSTIYSHSKQATGEIAGLSAIRAQGTNLFLEMMWRNQLRHAYRSVNENGLIVADCVEAKLVEVVFKKYCEGTDKHSFYEIAKDPSVVLDTGEYLAGPYIRFDWRNPNHVSVKKGLNVALNPYYYLLEDFYGKEKFFDAFLRDGKKVKPFGDRSIYSDMLGSVIDVAQTRESALKLYCAIQGYFHEVGLDAKDGCFMLDPSGKMFWSELNQDCLRIQAMKDRESLDKDIWRAGGSAAKELIVKKWLACNSIMAEYLASHKFVESELKEYTHYYYQNEVNRILNDKRLRLTPMYNEIYQKIRYQNPKRAVILTLDLYDGKPSLVKSGVVSEVHSDGNVIKAFEAISFYPDILVVDLNGAYGDKKNNREIIKKLAKRRYIYSGGGIRSIEDAQEVLQSSARRVVVGSNTEEDFIKQIPPNRLIVELTVDDKNDVLIYGRKTNTHVNLFVKIEKLLKMGIDTISITFHKAEGQLQGLPREQIAKIMAQMPDGVERVIIAGGIASLDDLEFLWSFPRIVPQLGLAVWRKKILLGELYAAMARYNGEGLINAVVQDINGMVKGVVWLNKEALKMTYETKLLHKYSKKRRLIVCKGEKSKRQQRVIQMSLSCNSDSVLVTVEGDVSFCRTRKASCFQVQNIVKTGMRVLMDRIKPAGSGFFSPEPIKSHPGLALIKLMKEYWEVACTEGMTKVSECANFIGYFFMYLNSINVDFDDILNELNSRVWDPDLIRKAPEDDKSAPKTVCVGIMQEKYTQYPDEFAKNVLGLEVVRPKGRKLKVTYNILHKEKYAAHFGDKELTLIPMRPKDMPLLMGLGGLDFMITYDNIVTNNPIACTRCAEAPVDNICQAFIKRRGEEIDVDKWTASNKALIASEYMNDAHNFLVNGLKIDGEKFVLMRVVGMSETYIMNDTKHKFILCDSIVETGATIKENDLEIWKMIRDYGDIKIGLYKTIH